MQREIMRGTLLMKLGLIGALARGVFAMDAARAEAYMPLVLNILEHGDVAAAPGNNTEGCIKPYGKNPMTGQEFSPYKYDANTDTVRFSGFSDAPKGTVAVIPVTDAIMKYDYCGSLGTQSLAAILKDADASQNIVGILLDMDTPGGEVYGTKNLSDAVAGAKKPVVAHINDGYCASAGYYIACRADEILLSQPTDQVGSIGVYTTLVDAKGMYEARGFKILEVYSPTSPDKNAAWREAMKNGNTKRIEADLAHLDAVFMQQVREGRGEKLDPKTLDGGMFYAADAIAKGLADGMATQEEAIIRVVNLSGKALII